jgi:hypothetical protein
MKIYRQGDVLLVSATIPSTAKKVQTKGDVILALGEVTGHAHRIKEGAAIERSTETERFVQVLENTFLLHEEHGSIALAPGGYKIVQQREYTPAGLRNVAD